MHTTPPLLPPRSAAFRGLVRPALGLLLLSLPIGARASDPGSPDWWVTLGVTNGNPLDDFAVVNRGQLKNMVAQTAAEFNNDLLNPYGGSGSAINNQVAAWISTPGPDDYAAINLGELKAAALPFYQRLQAIGALTTLPAWCTPGATGSDDYAMANLGQMKYLFSFQFLNITIVNGRHGFVINGLNDAWELNWFGQVGIDPNGDPTGDGLTNAQKSLLGADPLSEDNPALGLLLYK